MKVIYLHEESGKTFKTKKGYENFDKKYQEKKKQENILKNKLGEYRNFPRLNATTFSDYARLCIEYINKINEGTGVTYSDLKFYNLTFSNNLSNSHSAPIGKPTNWRGEFNSPTGYPGYGGMVTFKVNYRDSEQYWKGEYVKMNGAPYVGIVGLNTGSGGGRDSSNVHVIYQYDVKLFLDDFPIIKEKDERRQELIKLKEEHNNHIHSICYANVENDFLYKKMNSELIELHKIITICNNKKAQIETIRYMLQHFHGDEVTNSNPFPYESELNSLGIL